VTTTIISAIEDVRVQASYDTLLDKYCLQMGTNSGLVEFLIHWEHLRSMSDQLLAFVAEGDRSQERPYGRKAS